MQKIQKSFWVLSIQMSAFATLLGNFPQESVDFDSPIQLAYDVSRWGNEKGEENVIIAENESSLIDEIALGDIRCSTKEKEKSSGER